MNERRLDRQAEANHQHQLTEMLDRMPFSTTPESQSLRKLIGRVIGKGEAPPDESRSTWRGSNHPGNR